MHKQGYFGENVRTRNKRINQTVVLNLWLNHVMCGVHCSLNVENINEKGVRIHSARVVQQLGYLS